MNLQNKFFIVFVQTFQKEKSIPLWKFNETMIKKRKNLVVWECHLTVIKKEAFKSNGLQLLNHSLSFFLKNCSLLSATCVLSPSSIVYNTTASLDDLTWTDYVNFGKTQNRFGQFFPLKGTLTISMSNILCSGETTTKTFARSKISEWEKAVSASSCYWGIRRSLQQKTLIQRKKCLHLCCQDCPKTWMDNWNCLTRLLTYWTEQIETLMWLCCGTVWTSQRVHLPKSEYLQGKRMARSFNKL